MTDQANPVMLKRGDGGAVHVLKRNPRSSAGLLLTLCVIPAAEFGEALEALRQADEAAEQERLRLEREAAAKRIAAEKPSVATAVMPEAHGSPRAAK